MASAPSVTPPTAAPPRLWLCPALGLGVTLFQVILVGALSGQPDVSAVYGQLFQWDSVHYASIVDNGYVGPPPTPSHDHGNVSFFPGYPFTGWLVHGLTGWTTPVSLIAVAQAACWGFWTYVFLLFRRWRIAPGLTALGCLLIASHPAAFFLVAGYSESLFLMSLLGFIYWTDEGSAAGLVLAALHGFVLTATRIAGAPVVLYPLLHVWLNAPRGAIPPWRRLVRLLPPLAVGAAASLGAGLFFLYCHYRFGHWDLYMRTQQLGWNVRPDYLALFSWRAYFIDLMAWQGGFVEPTWFSRFSVPLTVGVFVGLIVAEVRWRRATAATGWRTRAGVYAVALLVFYICVSGVGSLAMASMIRYSLTPAVLLLLCLIHLLARAGRVPAWLRVVLAVWVLVGWACQIAFALRFTHGLWVA